MAEKLFKNMKSAKVFEKGTPYVRGRYLMQIKRSFKQESGNPTKRGVVFVIIESLCCAVLSGGTGEVNGVPVTITPGMSLNSITGSDKTQFEGNVRGWVEQLLCCSLGNITKIEMEQQLAEADKGKTREQPDELDLFSNGLVEPRTEENPYGQPFSGMFVIVEADGIKFTQVRYMRSVSAAAAKQIMLDAGVKIGSVFPGDELEKLIAAEGVDSEGVATASPAA